MLNRVIAGYQIMDIRKECDIRYKLIIWSDTRYFLDISSYLKKKEKRKTRKIAIIIFFISPM